MSDAAAILVADDRRENAELVCSLLEMEGFTTFKAFDGGEALEKIRLHLPDLVILDLDMPVLNGYEVCARMKADQATANIPVLMLTAWANPAQQVIGLQVGVDDYIAKPFDYQELLGRIRTRLRSKQEADKLRAAQKTIRETFARYVSPKVVERLLADPTQVRLGGAEQTITIVFADLRGYTSLAEALPPDQLVDVLNGYLTVAAEAMLTQEGTISRYAGDLIMSIFNAPLPQPDHVLRAAKAALRLCEEMDSYCAGLPDDLRKEFGVGLVMGEAVVGNIGARDWLNYTAIGDSVNLAQRLEELAGGGEILMDRDTYQALSEVARAESRGVTHVRGRSEPVEVYALLDLTDEEAT
jgi:adenylate cyclase